MILLDTTKLRREDVCQNTSYHLCKRKWWQGSTRRPENFDVKPMKKILRMDGKAMMIVFSHKSRNQCSLSLKTSIRPYRHILSRTPSLGFGSATRSVAFNLYLVLKDLLYKESWMTLVICSLILPTATFSMIDLKSTMLYNWWIKGWNTLVSGAD